MDFLNKKFLSRCALNLLAALTMLGLGCSPKGTDQYAIGVHQADKVLENDKGKIIDPVVDILFVIDNSGSMQDHQANLARNIGLFTQAFSTFTDVDYQIGVVTTDTEGDVWSTTPPCCGKLVGDVKFVTKNTPQSDVVLAQNILVGIDGSGVETSFEPVRLALSAPNLTGWNNGFLRPNASLIVIFITDAEDQSDNFSAADLYKFLVQTKGNDSSKVLGYGVIVPSSDRTCPRDDGTKPTKIESFLGMVRNAGTNIMDLCAPNFGHDLTNMANDIVRTVGSVILLARVPDVNSIQVIYGSRVLPADPVTGWSFDPKQNAIILGPKVDWSGQPTGTKIKIVYNAASLDEEKP